MLRKKHALILSSVAITLLASASYANSDDIVSPSDLRKGAGLPQNKKLSDNSWIKNPQTTTIDEAAKKARQGRLDEMKKDLNLKQDPTQKLTNDDRLKKSREEFERRKKDRLQQGSKGTVPSSNPTTDNPAPPPLPPRALRSPVTAPSAEWEPREEDVRVAGELLVKLHNKYGSGYPRTAMVKSLAQDMKLSPPQVEKILKAMFLDD